MGTSSPNVNAVCYTLRLTLDETWRVIGAMSAITLHHDAAAIELMGGTTAVARLLDYSTQRVQNWKYRGIPDAERLRLIYEYKVWPTGQPTQAKSGLEEVGDVA